MLALVRFIKVNLEITFVVCGTILIVAGTNQLLPESL